MSIQAPQGILNIPNATLRVGRLEISEVVGADTALNTIARNTILLVDGETYHENKNWGLKLPNAWAGEFECNTASAGNYSEFNFYNEGASSNAQGYNLTFNDTAAELRYDGTLLKTGTLPSTVTGTGVKKVRLMFERTILSVTVDGTLIFTHDDTGGPRPRVYSTTAGGFLNFFTDGGALKNLKIVNEKWISDGTSNIAYVGGGEVAVGKALAFNRVSNVSQIKVSSNVVAEYTGPHDRPLRKYPEVALTADAETASGYKGYKVTASDDVDNNSNLDKFRAFNGITGNEGWASDGNKYTFGTGVANVGGDSLGNVEGQWLKLQLPLKIKLSHIKLTTRDISSTAYPKDFQILGSNDDSNWTQLINVIDAPYTQHLTLTHHVTGTVDSFQYLAVVVTKTYGATGVDISELEYYGHEEGDSSLDTTLKSVYNVPATTGTQLEVYYDAKDLTEMPATVTDLAGGDQNGTPGTGVSFDSTYKAFVFDGTTTGVISNELPSTVTGAYVHSMSLWFKHSGTGNTLYTLVHIGDVNDSQSVMSDLLVYDTGKLRFGFYDNDSDTPDGIITLNQWYHVVATYSGGTGNAHSRKIYVNGKEIPLTLSGASNANSLSLPSDPMLYLGSQQGSLRLTGSIANFRLYSKALNADQVKELYDYQKDYFLGSKSQVTLYKGHLGIGVTEPSGQLELAGDERIQEYPPRGFGVFAEDPDYSTHIEGHGVFTAYGSSQNNTGKSYSVIGAFDKTVSPDNSCWLSATNTYSGGLPASSAAKINGVSGEWCALQCPYPIKLQSFTTRVRSASSGENGRMAKSGIIWGSNDGATWYQVHSWGGRVYSDTNSNYFEVNSTEYYSHHAFQATELQGSSTATTLGEWRLFGTPGPTTLDKGSLTLGRSLDVPRVSRYDVDTETPRPEKLVVDFDTTVNNSPTDISGKGNHGVFYGTNMNYSSADKAFAFNGTDDYIGGQISTAGGDFIHSFSFWVKYNAIVTSEYIFSFGSASTLGRIGYYISNAGVVRIVGWGGGNIDYTFTHEPNRWYHVCGTYSGGGWGTNTKLYIDGVEYVGTGGGGNNLSIPANPVLDIGRLYNSLGGTGFLDGKISNFKIYNVALEPSEVKKLYRLGRTGRSMVISDTAVGIGKVPEAQLDVRGSLVVRGGNVMIQEDTVSVKLKTNPGYSSLISGGSMFIANPSTSGGYEHFIMNNSTTGNHQTTYFSFRRNNGQIGSILTSSGSTINFNTGSDYRLKENIVPMSNEGLVVINKLQPKTFNFKTNPGETVYGFIAHELQEHIPMAVSGEKDEMRGEEPMYQGVDASKIVPYLVKAVQELYEENQTLKTRLDTLEGASNVVAEEETSNVA
jgi:hypothetical protein